MKTEYYENGEALVKQYDGKKIVSIAYVNRNEQIITYTKYEDSNSISTETISSPSAKSIRSVAAQSGLIQLGSIKYYYESSATYPVKGTRLMNILCVQMTTQLMTCMENGKIWPFLQE